MKQAGAAGLSTEAPPAETEYETTIVRSRLPDMMKPNTIATVVLPNRPADHEAGGSGAAGSWAGQNPNRRMQPDSALGSGASRTGKKYTCIYL